MGRGDSRFRGRRRKRTRDALQFDPHYGAGRDVFDALVRQVEHASTHATRIETMKACIYGAGAIGGWMGVRSRRRAASVPCWRAAPPCRPCARTACAWTRRWRQHALPVQASADPGRARRAGPCGVAVKAPALPAVAHAHRAAAGPGHPGADGHERCALVVLQRLRRRTAQARGCTRRSRRRDRRGVPAQHSSAAWCTRAARWTRPASCAPLRQRPDRRRALGRRRPRACWRWPTLLQRAGLEAALSEQIQRDVWYKLWGNMTVNPVSALTGATTDLILDDELVRGFITRVMLEAKDIGARIGIPIDAVARGPPRGDAQARRLQDLDAAGRGSRKPWSSTRW